MKNEKINRRDFLKMVGAGIAILTIPKAVPEFDNYKPPKPIPHALQLALYRRSTMMLDYLGISATGLNDKNFDSEVLRRWQEL